MVQRRLAVGAFRGERLRGDRALLDTAAQAGLSLDGAVHVVWTTGGSLLPDEEFEKLLGSPAA